MRRLTDAERDLAGEHARLAWWLARRACDADDPGWLRDKLHDLAVSALLWCAARWEPGRGSYPRYVGACFRMSVRRVHARHGGRRAVRLAFDPVAAPAAGGPRLEAREELEAVVRLAGLTPAEERTWRGYHLGQIPTPDLAGAEGVSAQAIDDRRWRADRKVRSAARRRGGLETGGVT